MGLELMGDGQPSASAKAEILRNIGELDQLVDEILLASRLESKETDVGTPESVDLIGLAAEECARVEAELDLQAPARWRCRALQAAAPCRAQSAGKCPPLQPRRHHADPGAGRRHGSDPVQDHGPGVPAAQRERIFEKFYRLPGASERSGGVGLGLSLVRSIAERHGGTVRHRPHRRCSRRVL
jgi:signal transduction histidine kinase